MRSHGSRVRPFPTVLGKRRPAQGTIQGIQEYQAIGGTGIIGQGSLGQEDQSAFKSRIIVMERNRVWRSRGLLGIMKMEVFIR